MRILSTFGPGFMGSAVNYCLLQESQGEDVSFDAVLHLEANSHLYHHIEGPSAFTKDSDFLNWCRRIPGGIYQREQLGRTAGAGT